MTFTPDEFTIDFIRLNPYRSGGVVVARIACSPNAARDLTLNLVSQLRSWADTVISEEGGDGDFRYRAGEGGNQILPPDVAKRAANPPPAKGRFAKAIAASRLATARKILKLDP